MRISAKIPTIYPLDKDLKKTWFVRFWTKTGKRSKRLIPNFATSQERLVFATNFITTLNNPDKHTKKRKTTSKVPYIKHLYAYVESIKIRLRKHTYQCYVSHVNSLEQYCIDNKVTSLSDEVIELYILHLTNSISNASINDRAAGLRRFFAALKKKGVVRKNPFENFVKLPEHSEGKRAFSVFQIEIIKEYINKNAKYKPILLPLMIQYYCFIRPKELIQLQIKHIDFDNGKILVPSTIAKNKKSQFVTIPKEMLSILIKEKLYDFPLHYYIIGKLAKTSITMCGKNYIQRKFKEVLNALNIDTINHSQYSMKHTGNTRLYKAGVGIKDIQRHNRHSSLEMTDIYLKSLGLEEQTEIKENFPSF